ncbi:MAG: thioesterase family protein [Methyloligellaceae bacterium]
MRPIPAGATGRFELTVSEEHLAASFKDPLLPRVFATPWLVLLIENASLNAVRDYLEPGESCVGTEVHVTHLAATPPGMRVTGEARVTAVDGRRVSFDVIARDDQELIGRGAHERVVIDVASFDQRMKEKAAKG